MISLSMARTTSTVLLLKPPSLFHTQTPMAAVRSFVRTMATATRTTEPIAFTSEGAVSISYSTLVASPSSLTASIGRRSVLNVSTIHH